MRVNWIFSAAYNPGPEVDLAAIKNIGSTWGSWKSWRACNTDNVICHDKSKSQELIQRNFQNSCNFYVPKDHYQSLGRPMNVNLYNGEFHEAVDDLEDIIAMHLISNSSDIVLLAGFDFSTQEPATDRLQQHRVQNRLGLFYRLLVNNPETQWVLVNHHKPLDKAYSKLPNITCDVMKNVLQLLN